MSKNDNAHALRLMDALRRHAGEQEAQRVADAYPLSKSADIGKKFAWALTVSTDLEAHHDDATLRSIRRDCRCNDGRAIADKLRKYLNKAESMEAFVQLFNEHETFAQLGYVSDRCLLFCYPECYCACVKRVPGHLPRAWCYCTLGNAEAIFSQVFDCPIHATLLESIKTGGRQCVIQVEW